MQYKISRDIIIRAKNDTQIEVEEDEFFSIIVFYFWLNNGFLMIKKKVEKINKGESGCIVSAKKEKN